MAGPPLTRFLWLRVNAIRLHAGRICVNIRLLRELCLLLDSYGLSAGGSGSLHARVDGIES